VALSGQLHHEHALGFGLLALAFGRVGLAEEKGEVHGLVLQKQVVQGIIQHHGRKQVAHIVLEVAQRPFALLLAQFGLAQQVNVLGIELG